MTEKKETIKPKRMVIDEFHYLDGNGKSKVAMAELSPKEVDEMLHLAGYGRVTIGKVPDDSSN